MGRWRRHLDPSIKRDGWEDEEDDALRELYAEYGEEAVRREAVQRRRQPVVWGRQILRRIEIHQLDDAQVVEGANQREHYRHDRQPAEERVDVMTAPLRPARFRLAVSQRTPFSRSASRALVAFDFGFSS